MPGPGPNSRFRTRCVPRVLVGLVAGLACTMGAATEDAERFFESEVRPLLLQACGECHGPTKQQAGLRLDTRDALLAGGDSGAAFDADHPERSLLLEVIGYEGAIRMPPRQKLPDAQLAVLRKWVLQGAPWSMTATAGAHPRGLRGGPITDEDRRHWAYQPIRKPPVPQVPNAGWPHTDVDRFILQGLEAAGLQPVGDADKLQLLRRVSLDVIGLPPTPEEIEAFLADASPDAFSRVVDRLLASPHYGERWGRHWLDLARYADTAGDGADYPVREAYKYRNYVIDSFNADKPYDLFLREQIAGDILAQRAAAAGAISAERYAEQVVATGYIAVTKRFGYDVNTEFQHLDIADTLETVGRSLLGLSIGCARCHDHKYDAITMEDYYALYGIFASSRYSFPGGEEHKRPHDLVPLALPAEMAAVRARQKSEQAELDRRKAALDEERERLVGGVQRGVSGDPGLELQRPGQPGGPPWFTAGPNTVLAAAQSPYAHVLPTGTQGVRIAPGKVTDGIRQTFAPVTANTAPRFHYNLDFRNVTAVEGDGAYRLYLGHGAIVTLAIECSVNSRSFAVRNGDRFEVVRAVEPGVWYNLQLSVDMERKTFSGRIGTPGDVVEFRDFAVASGWDGVLDTFVCDGYGQVQAPAPSHDVDNVVGQVEPFPPLTPTVKQATSSAAAGDAPARPRARLDELDEELKQLAAARAALEASGVFPLAYGVSEGQPANARVQKRGEPLRPGAEVPRRWLEILGGDPLPDGSTGSGRLELAEWVTRPSNPLTARVFVNRVWQQLLGRGLVATPSDFGTRGEGPTHPELLDFLAAEFVEDGWSIKRLQRRILLSHVYRLASTESAELQDTDPANRLLGRRVRRALDAESIRDAMLAVSGELARDQGGPHPFPDVNTWRFTIHEPFHAVYDSNQRSVYLMIQRARRHPYLALFDAADPNISTATRDISITPTQSLYLMNSPFVHARAAALAGRLLAEEADEPARITRAFAWTFSRPPTAAETDEAAEFLERYRSALQSAGQADAEHGAWSALGRVLLTSNEFLYVD